MWSKGLENQDLSSLTAIFPTRFFIHTFLCLALFTSTAQKWHYTSRDQSAELQMLSKHRFDLIISTQHRKFSYTVDENHRCAHGYLSKWWGSRNCFSGISSWEWSMRSTAISSCQSYPVQVKMHEMHLMKEKCNHEKMRYGHRSWGAWIDIAPLVLWQYDGFRPL